MSYCMIPKTEIRYSYIYNRVFDSKFLREDVFKLRKNCEGFEMLYSRHIEDILKSIENHHLKEWSYGIIPIYIVRKAEFNFSDPLTLKYIYNEKRMLVVLAHELLHNNMARGKFRDSKELHAYMEAILDKVILDLDIDLRKELKEFNLKCRKDYGF